MKHINIIISVAVLLLNSCCMLQAAPSHTKEVEQHATTKQEEHTGMLEQSGAEQSQEFEIDFPHRVGAERIWFIPGWRHHKTPAGKYMELFKEVFKKDVYVYSWNASGNWSEAKNEVSNEARRLARKIASCPRKQRNEMILIGHSLGARMIAEALQLLLDRNIRVKQVILLGGALPFNDSQLKNIEKLSIEKPINIFNREDGVLRTDFNIAEKTFACGCIGIGGQTQFQQYEVQSSSKNQRTFSTEINDHYNHLVQQYMETLKQVLNGEASKSTVPDFDKVNEILANAGLEKKKVKITMPKVLAFTIVERKEGWEYGYYKLDIKYKKVIIDEQFYAIFDPFGRWVFNSSEKSEAEAKWLKIKDQLNK